MEILRLPGYTEYEKVEIAKRFLVEKEMTATGVTPKHLEFTQEGIQAIVRGYTREAGVRNLDREISSVCRKVARTIAHGKNGEVVKIDADNLTQYIGVPRFRSARHEEKDEVGFVTGLAWTEVGGEILSTEATLMSGRGKLTLTGKLGEVMQESARAAMSFVRSRAEQFGIPKDFHRRLDLHIHVPEGAIPKDGPSAGVTMATSLVSTLTGIPVRSDVAMTGEITLRGKVLAIGGVKEKLLAAHRAGIRTVILPRDNQKDLADVPTDIREEFTLHLVDTMEEVLQVALTRPLVPGEEEIAERGFPPEIAGNSEVSEGPVMH